VAPAANPAAGLGPRRESIQSPRVAVAAAGRSIMYSREKFTTPVNVETQKTERAMVRGRASALALKSAVERSSKNR
jgi:hypothetical protein